MTTSLDTIRYHSGIAGEEVANMVDELEAKVEKLTKERDIKEHCIVQTELEVERLTRKFKQVKCIAQPSDFLQKLLANVPL